jgi:hypothetical protein
VISFLACAGQGHYPHWQRLVSRRGAVDAEFAEGIPVCPSNSHFTYRGLLVNRGCLMIGVFYTSSFRD